MRIHEGVHDSPWFFPLRLKSIGEISKWLDMAPARVMLQSIERQEGGEKITAANPAHPEARRIREAAERRVREVEERKAREAAERKAREEAERKAAAEKERRVLDEWQRKARGETEKKAREEAEHKAREEKRLRKQEAEDDGWESLQYEAFESEVNQGREETEKERKRIEEERRRKEEEEQRRIEEEERKRREEAERKRREEAERKAREEAERKAREEAESKERKKEERRARVEAKRKAREEAERRAQEEAELRAVEKAKRRAREKAERKAREEAERSKRNVDVRAVSDLALRKAWSCITDNPYFILGISVTSTRTEASEVLDKLQKLARLHAESSYRGSFVLDGIPGPDRDVSLMQAALPKLSSMRYSWFWFADREACAFWQNPFYLKQIYHLKRADISYDLFLANYLYALFFDPDVLEPRRWAQVFVIANSMSKEKEQERLKSRFHEGSEHRMRGQELTDSFLTEIFRPVQELCGPENVERTVRILECLDKASVKNFDDLWGSLLSSVTAWFVMQKDRIYRQVSSYGNLQNLSESASAELMEMGRPFAEKGGQMLKQLLPMLEGESVRREMLEEAYHMGTGRLMYALSNAENKWNAVYYANKYYPYCNRQEQLNIRMMFKDLGTSALKYLDSEEPGQEFDSLGDDYRYGRNGRERDDRLAFKAYVKGAQAGNKYSMNSLGVFYQTGRVVRQNDQAAFRCYSNAHGMGNPDATENLALCYEHGIGVKADINKAIDLHMDAAQMGSVAAAERLEGLIDQLKRFQGMLDESGHVSVSGERQEDDYDI